MSESAFALIREAEERKARALFRVEDFEKVLERVGQRPRLLPTVLGLAIRMPVRGVLGRARQFARVDVVLVDGLGHTVDRLGPEAQRLRDLA